MKELVVLSKFRSLVEVGFLSVGSDLCEISISEVRRSNLSSFLKIVVLSLSFLKSLRSLDRSSFSGGILHESISGVTFEGESRNSLLLSKGILSLVLLQAMVGVHLGLKISVQSLSLSKEGISLLLSSFSSLSLESLRSS